MASLNMACKFNLASCQGRWANIGAYVTVIVGDYPGDRLDLAKIWMWQEISGSLRDLIWDWAVIMKADFNCIPQSQNILEVAERRDSSERIKKIGLKLVHVG